MKTCGSCHESKPMEQFNWQHRATGKRRTICKICARVYCRRYYLKDTHGFLQAKKARDRRYRERARSFIAQFLTSHPCVDCGETNAVVLEFDHVSGEKQEDVSILVSQGASLSRLAAEVAKCEVRCANCHRKRTSQVRGYWKGGAASGETMPRAVT